MIARSQLAAVLDFNCGVGLNQAVTKSGKLRYKQQSRHAIMGSQKDISIKREILHYKMSDIFTRRFHFIKSPPDLIWVRPTLIMTEGHNFNYFFISTRSNMLDTETL